MYRIRLEPAGREFMASPNETLLDAALRAGVNVSYNCKNGSCGQCLARLRSGRLGQSQPHDYRINEREQDGRYFLLCAATPASDLVIESAVLRDPDSIPQQEIPTRVDRIDAVADNIRILQLRTPRSTTLQFMAGQYLTLHLDGLEPRNKSIASCPCNGMYLQFHVRRVAGDAFSARVFDNLTLKTPVRVSGPHGRFTLDETSSRPLLFIANDTGIAPIKSLLEHHIALESTQPSHLYWLIANRNEEYLANHCRAWRDALDDFIYTPILLDEPGAAPHDNLLQAAQCIVGDYPDLSGFDVYLNGPAEPYQVLTQILLQHGLPAERLFIDSLPRY